MEFISIGALILAAGKGSRMHSSSPKVLQHILKEPMLRYVFDTLPSIVGDNVWTVVGHKSSEVIDTFPNNPGGWIVQEPQLGTGHALQIAWDTIKESGIEFLIVLNGDTPLIPQDLLCDFIKEATRNSADISFVSLELDNPGSFGRVVRTDGVVSAIVEAKDFSVIKYGSDVKEINAGIYCLKVSSIGCLLFDLSNNNESNEYYLTDLVKLALSSNLKVYCKNYEQEPGLLGINSPLELVKSEEYIRSKIVNNFLESGVIIRQPDSVRIGPDVIIEPGVEITGPCELYGRVHVMRGARIESHCVIETSIISANAYIRNYTHICESHIGEHCVVGPFARIRPETVLGTSVKVGNFVEIKKSYCAEGSKVNHLSYIGDSEVGKGSNIGAGTITCNYDGVNKYSTIIGEHAFVGSNCSLVAPVTIGNGSLVGAGSVITEDVSDNMLALARSRQIIRLKKTKDSLD